MANENSALVESCVGELVIWKKEAPMIIIYDASELSNLEARRAGGLVSGPMARREFPGIRALGMYKPLMAAVEGSKCLYRTHYSREGECGCEFSGKYLTERGMARVGNILLRLRGIPAVPVAGN